MSYCPTEKGTGRTRTAVIAFAEQHLSLRSQYQTISPHSLITFDIVALHLLFVNTALVIFHIY
jgi:hypothetical protein